MFNVVAHRLTGVKARVRKNAQMAKRLMLGVRVTDEMMAALKIEATRDRRTVSAYVENLLFDLLAERGHSLDGQDGPVTIKPSRPKRTKK